MFLPRSSSRILPLLAARPRRFLATATALKAAVPPPSAVRQTATRPSTMPSVLSPYARKHKVTVIGSGNW